MSNGILLCPVPEVHDCEIARSKYSYLQDFYFSRLAWSHDTGPQPLSEREGSFVYVWFHGLTPRYVGCARKSLKYRRHLQHIDFRRPERNEAKLAYFKQHYEELTCFIFIDGVSGGVARSVETALIKRWGCMFNGTGTLFNRLHAPGLGYPGVSADTQSKKAVKLWRRGERVAGIADALGVCRLTIYNALDRRGAARPRNPKISEGLKAAWERRRQLRRAA